MTRNPVTPTAPDDVISSAELRARGITTHAMSTRCRPSGPWQRVLPGVVLMSGGRPSRRQRLRAALTYAGPDAVVTGVDAMRAHGIDVPETPDVVVLVPVTRRLTSRSFLTVERTTRPPDAVWSAKLPYAPLARATLDAARRVPDQNHLRSLLTSAVGRCSVEELRAELDAGSQRGSAAVRALLTDRLAGASEVVPAAISMARRLVRAASLPSPHWQAPVWDRAGMLLTLADAWWDEVSLAWDVGTRLRRVDQHTAAAAGVTLMRTDPQRLRDDPAGVTEALMAAYTDAVASPRQRVG
jgi:hypothetical protein